MGEAARKLLEEALKLSEEERGALVAVLSETLGRSYSQDEIDTAWAVEIQQRLDEVRSGRANLIPWEQVDAELHSQVPRR